MRIVIVGDHPVMRLGLTNQLIREPDIKIVGQATNRLEALEKAIELHPDVIIMDVTTPDQDWPGAITSIKAYIPNVRVLILTMSQTEEELFEAMRAGAWDYLPKNFTAGQALDMLRSMAVK